MNKEQFENIKYYNSNSVYENENCIKEFVNIQIEWLNAKNSNVILACSSFLSGKLKKVWEMKNQLWVQMNAAPHAGRESYHLMLQRPAQVTSRMTPSQESMDAVQGFARGPLMVCLWNTDEWLRAVNCGNDSSCQGTGHGVLVERWRMIARCQLRRFKGYITHSGGSEKFGGEAAEAWRTTSGLGNDCADDLPVWQTPFIDVRGCSVVSIWFDSPATLHLLHRNAFNLSAWWLKRSENVRQWSRCVIDGGKLWRWCAFAARVVDDTKLRRYWPSAATGLESSVRLLVIRRTM
jgi:hypothetical protein